MGKRTYLHQAEQAYERAISLIRSMDRTYQSDVFREHPQTCYDTAITLYQFDIILQTILLQIALSDGILHRLERRLIDSMARYGDLMTYLAGKTHGRLSLSWEKLQNMSEAERTELSQQLPAILEQTCNSFVLPLATVDGLVDSADFLAQLEAELQIIARSLCGIDGESLPSERSAYVNSLEHLLTCRWHHIKETVSAEEAETQD